MNVFLTSLFYTFVSSIIFVYGIGLERILIHYGNKTGLYFFMLKTVLKLIISVNALWFLNLYVFIPVGLRFILPVAAVLFLSLLEEADKVLLSKFPVIEEKETVFYWALVFFILYEAGSYIEALSALFSACAGLLVFSYILNAVKQKTDEGNAFAETKEYTLVLLAFGFVTAVLYAADICWFAQ